MADEKKPLIGITCGDVNGIGLELIIKTVADNRLLDLVTPIIFASNKVINFYRKGLPEINFNFQSTKDWSKINPKQVNVFNCWEEDVLITPGELNEIGGKYALISLQTAAQALKDGHIQGLVTAPIHKNNIQGPTFNYTGHTPYLQAFFGAQTVVMLMTAPNMRVGLLTEHLPIGEIAKHVTKENITRKLKVLSDSLKRDFGVSKPRIAVLGLNPHAGDKGLIGKEEEEIITPAIKEMRNSGMMTYGPYSADAFFAREQYKKFDAILAMYHDQGLIPFKSLAIGEGINYTAGLPVVRTSPDHGTAFDIAGKGIADASSFLQAIWECVDIVRRRAGFDDERANPLRKLSASMLARAVDEKIEE